MGTQSACFFFFMLEGSQDIVEAIAESRNMHAFRWFYKHYGTNMKRPSKSDVLAPRPYGTTRRFSPHSYTISP